MPTALEIKSKPLPCSPGTSLPTPLVASSGVSLSLPSRYPGLLYSVSHKYRALSSLRALHLAVHCHVCPPAVFQVPSFFASFRSQFIHPFSKTLPCPFPMYLSHSPPFPSLFLPPFTFCLAFNTVILSCLFMALLCSYHHYTIKCKRTETCLSCSLMTP